MKQFCLKAIKSVIITTLAVAISATSLVSSASAQRGLPLIRDAEIEGLMADYSKPIFEAAGLDKGRVNIHLVNSNQFNAFVVDGGRMFFNTGTLKQAKTPNEVIGVIAHEAGHITGGHLSRIRQAAAGARTIAIFSQILAGAALVAGGASGNTDIALGGIGALQGGGEIARRTLLAHQRTEEIAADRAGIEYLEKTGQSGKGMLDTFANLQRQIPVSSRFIDPFVLSHPLPRERIALISKLVERSKFKDRKDPESLIKRHALMQAKLAAYTEHPQKVGRMYPKSDKSLPADYARAIVGFRFGNVKKAQKQIDKLIARSPKNPYFWELKGQAYVDSGRPAEAIAPLRQALKLSPRQPLMQTLLGHALVSTEDPKHTNEAIKVLSSAIAQDQSIGLAHRQLALAYGRQGRIAEATLATANGLFYLGDIRGAKVQAARAQQRFKRGSPGWIQADDILSFRRPRL